MKIQLFRFFIFFHFPFLSNIHFWLFFSFVLLCWDFLLYSLCRPSYVNCTKQNMHLQFTLKHAKEVLTLNNGHIEWEKHSEMGKCSERELERESEGIVINKRYIMENDVDVNTVNEALQRCSVGEETEILIILHTNIG